MTCSICGARLDTADASCSTCGATVMTTERSPLPPRGDGVAVADRNGHATRPTRPRSTKVLAIVAAVALVLAAAIGVSRTQVAGRLSAADASLREVRDQLDASTSQVDTLERRVRELESAQAELHTQLERANAETNDVRQSLDACQDVFRMAAKFMNGGPPPSAVQVQVASKLMSCFEGELPPELF